MRYLFKVIVKTKVLIFIVAYNANKTIKSVMDRIPRELGALYDLTLLISDDCSSDTTYENAKEHLKSFWCKGNALRTPVNLGYGGNQKVGYQYAIENSFDVVVLLHGDGQYAPELLPNLLRPYLRMDGNTPEAVFGSRMINKSDALKGGMPYYKFIGNQILTGIQNLILGASLSEYHSGYRIYSVNALKEIPFNLNTNDFHFDTEIIVQFIFNNFNLLEIPIPTYYGDEVCHVDGFKYAKDVIKASIKARLIRLGIFYDPKFEVSKGHKKYVSKLLFQSTHLTAFDEVAMESEVLDLGCADGYLSEELANKKACKVYCCDMDPEKNVKGCNYQYADLNRQLPEVPWDKLDYILLMDVIEHLASPENFLAELSNKLSENQHVKIIVSSGNVCFFVTRIMMFLGQFNYGRRGILDITHTRLFTIASLGRVLRYSGYRVLKKHYVPAPYPLAIGLRKFSFALLKINNLLCKISAGLFAYQSVYIVQALPNTKSIINNITND